MDTIGPLVFLNFSGCGSRADAPPPPPPVSLREWMGPLERELAGAGGIGDNLTFVARRVYTMECNWKVRE